MEEAFVTRKIAVPGSPSIISLRWFILCFPPDFLKMPTASTAVNKIENTCKIYFSGTNKDGTRESGRN